jgi:hypothetical protein
MMMTIDHTQPHHGAVDARARASSMSVDASHARDCCASLAPPSRVALCGNHHRRRADDRIAANESPCVGESRLVAIFV